MGRSLNDTFAAKSLFRQMVWDLLTTYKKSERQSDPAWIIEVLSAITDFIAPTLHVNQYLGIPYAYSHVRFTDPQLYTDYKTWSGIVTDTDNKKGTTYSYDARFPKYNNVCVQQLPGQSPYGSEDCLYLNVWTPQTTVTSKTKLPVFVWIYGGIYEFGDGLQQGIVCEIAFSLHTNKHHLTRAVFNILLFCSLQVLIMVQI